MSCRTRQRSSYSNDAGGQYADADSSAHQTPQSRTVARAHAQRTLNSATNTATTLRGALGRYEAIRRDPTEDSPARADPERDDSHWSGHQRGRWACIGVAPSAWPRRRRRAVPEALLARVARGNKTASPASIQPARKQRTVHTRGAHARPSGRMHGRHQQRQQSPARERLRLLIVVAGAERAAVGPVEAGMP